MLVETQPVDYQTVVVGAAPLLKRLLTRLGVAEAIDRALPFQPDIATTYGALAQVIIVNRMTFQPTPLYGIAEWAAHHRRHVLSARPGVAPRRYHQYLL